MSYIYKNPEYLLKFAREVAMVPQNELLRRKNDLQEKMQSQNMDGILLAQNMSMYYMSGTMHCQYVYVPADGETLGLVRRNMERAKKETAVSLAPMSGFSALPGVFQEFGFKSNRIGLELDVLPATTYLRMAKTLSNLELADASTLVREVRQVKSEYELKQLHEAARQVDALHKQIPQLLCEGKDELEFAADCEMTLRKLGHQGTARMRGFNQEMFYGHVLSGATGAASSFLDSPTGGVGVSTAAPQGAGRKNIAKGEPVTVDYGGIVNGYIVDQTRLYSIGHLPEILSNAFNVALLIQEELLRHLIPGSTGGQVYDTALAVATKYNLQEHFMGINDTQAKYVGHGVGLEFDEFPILAKGSPHILRENMVIALEPKFTFPGLGVVGLENTWQVTGDGAKKISITPDAHVVL